MRIHDLLREMVERDASDLYVMVNSPPLLRVEGVNEPLGDAPLLRPSLRYAHPQAFILRRLAENGFDLVAMEKSVIRQDAGQPVHGLLFLARRQG